MLLSEGLNYFQILLLVAILWNVITLTSNIDDWDELINQKTLLFFKTIMFILSSSESLMILVNYEGPSNAYV